MGNNLRVPRPVYKNCIVVECFCKDKELHYTVYKWVAQADIQASLDSGKLGDKTPQQIMDFALQQFGDVIKN